MTHGATSIASKGCCISCKATNVPLSREHIVPLFIGGGHIIEQASCNACAKITSQFELDVARRLWGQARYSANAPGRKKRKRPTEILVGSPKQVLVPYSEIPPAFVFFKMPKPGIMQGFSHDVDLLDFWEPVVISSPERLQAFEAKYRTKPTTKLRFVPISFGRMLAKIGYGQILTQLDINDFEPLVLPLIFGASLNPTYLVGCTIELQPPDAGLGYMLKTLVEGSTEHAYIIAEVRLLANNFTPTYSIVVGQTRGRRALEQVVDKLGPCAIEVI